MLLMLRLLQRTIVLTMMTDIVRLLLMSRSEEG